MAIINLQRGTSWEKHTCGGVGSEISVVMGTNGVGADSGVCFCCPQAVSAALLWPRIPAVLLCFCFGLFRYAEFQLQYKGKRAVLRILPENLDLSSELSLGQYVPFLSQLLKG